MAFAQVAVLHNGTPVTMKIPQETFSIEGPMWDLDIPNRTVIATGFRVTIPASLNGVEFVMGNTQVVNNEEVSLGGITSATFDRLGDVNAATRDRIFETAGDAGPIRLGPARSLFSTSEARGVSVSGLDRDPQIEKAMEDNYFFLARNAFLQYSPGILPANFLGLIGIRNEVGGFPANNNQLPPRRFWRYPSSGGATFIAQGSVYVDAAGNEYNVPDFPIKGSLAHVILAENVCIGNMKGAAIGNYNTPDSFVIGDTLIMMNQDPRMPLDIIGIAGSPVSREYFTTQIPAGTFVAAVGHMIGEHVMFAEVIDVSATAFDPAVGAWTSVIDRTWGFRPGRGLSFRGSVVPASTTLLSAQYGSNGVFTAQEISLESLLVVDPLLDEGRFDVRDLAGADPVATRQIKFIIRDAATKAVIREVVYNWADILGL
ncbi:MAG: hypothetical protein ACOYMM_06650 [Phycisphaerales bacterium]